MAHLLIITTQICLTLVPTVWFVANQTRTTATRMGMRWPLCEYSTSNRCLHYLIGTCDKGITNGPIVSIQELNVFKTCMLWMMFTIFATKIEHQFLSDVDMKRKKTQTWHQSWYTASRGFMRWYGIKKQMLNKQTIVNNLIAKLKKVHDDNEPYGLTFTWNLN